MSTDGRMLWANQLFNKVLLAVARDPTTGTLSRLPAADIPLPAYADNVEFDHASGNLFIGDVGGLTLDPFEYHYDGGLIVAERHAEGSPYTLATGFRQKSSPTHSGKYVVSSTVPWGQWVVVGSPFQAGLVICKADAGSGEPEDIVSGVKMVSGVKLEL